MTDQNKNVSHSPAPNLEQELLRFKSLEKDLHFSQERVLKLLHYSSQSLMILDKIGKILWVNHYTEIMTGYSYDELVGKNASILQSHHHSPEYYQAFRESLDRDDYWKGEFINRRKNGFVYSQLVEIIDISDDPDIPEYLMISSDVSALAQAFDQASSKARVNVLTGFPNQSSLRNLIDYFLHNKISHSIILIDLANLANINILYGFESGDGAIEETALRIRSFIHNNEYPYRIYNHYFVLVINNDKAIQDFNSRIYTLMETMTKSFHIPSYDIEIPIQLYMGISQYPKDGTEFEELINAAEFALEESRIQGINSVIFAEKSSAQNLRDLFSLGSDILIGLRENQFEMHFQAAVMAKTRRIIAVESLLRWHHPSRGLIYPGDFIPYAEESGLIVPLCFWTIEYIFKLYLSNPFFKDENLIISINLSPKILEDESFIPTLKQLLKKYPVNTNRIIFELTEHSLLYSLEESRRVFDELHLMGFRISLDDYGNRYSSLLRFRSLNFDYLKIDRNFVTDVSQDPQLQNFIESILVFTRFNRIFTIAEGVENELCARVLEELGIDALQGYYFAKPLPLDEFISFYEAKKKQD